MTIALATCLPEHSDRPKISSLGECNSCYSRRKFKENPHLLAVKKRREHERYLEKKNPKMTQPIVCVECTSPFVRKHWNQRTCDDCKAKSIEGIKWRECNRCGDIFFRNSNSQKHCADCAETTERDRKHHTALPQPQEPECMELPPFRPLPKATATTSGLKWAHRKFDPDVVRSMASDPNWGWHDD